jgi:ABC-type uncharacterized transport system ATPase subunit
VLSDVERTCEAVLLLREGRVVSAGLLSELGAGESSRLLVRVVGDVARFRAALAARGLVATDDEDAIVIEGSGRRELDGVRDAAAAADVSLRELRRAERTLEDAVVSAMT